MVFVILSIILSLYGGDIFVWIKSRKEGGERVNGGGGLEMVLKETSIIHKICNIICSLKTLN